ncbi:hypothetical protein Ciccas_007502 [Cichlidogyrus casuarinus]|uniref:Uncharacterized protein n=1 Tax=Cichlidogyrus casuarinus TaxID=1844966 RepID=A0ABD2Q2R6_9PLAT
MFFILEPKLDFLIIGKGTIKDKVDSDSILKLADKYDIAIEILPTVNAIGTFNIMNQDERYVGAALIPPHRIDIFDQDYEAAKRIKAREATELQLINSSQNNPHLETWSDRRKKLLEGSSKKLISPSPEDTMLRSVLKTRNSARLCFIKCKFSTEVKKTPEEIREESLSNLSYAARKEVEFMSGPQVVDCHANSTTPLMKELFLGRLGVEIFSFPELENKEAVDDLDMMYDQVKKFMLSIDSAAIDKNSSIPKDVLQGVADLGLFGQQIDPAFGGLGLNATQTSRLAEATTLDPSIAVTLAAHQSIGLKGILLVGTEEQKQKYLPKLASGEHIAAFCLSEPSSGSDVQSIRTKAELDPSGKFWVINGGKCWISNGSMAQIMTVFAKTKVKNDQVYCYTLF